MSLFLAADACLSWSLPSITSSKSSLTGLPMHYWLKNHWSHQAFFKHSPHTNSIFLIQQSCVIITFCSKEIHRRSQRVRQLPARFRVDTSTESDSDSGILCGLCNARESPNEVSIVFWVDCGNCGDWFHTSCVLGDNSHSCQYVCANCV